MVNRLYVLFTKHQIKVKGFLYSQAEQPIGYWFWVGAATFGLCAGTGLFTLAMVVLLGWLP